MGLISPSWRDRPRTEVPLQLRCGASAPRGRGGESVSLPQESAKGFCFMSRPSIYRQYGLTDGDIEKQVAEVLAEETGAGELSEAYEASVKNYEVGSILPGRVVNIIGDSVIIDIGYKSEGAVEKKAVSYTHLRAHET